MSEKLPKPAGGGHEISARESRRMVAIMAEFVEATERPGMTEVLLNL